MNEVHFHLAVTHLPIIFTIVGIIVLVTGLISKSEAVKRTAYLIFSIGALTSIAAMTSGEGSEDIVENIDGINESFIETHEEAAELFSILTYILGGLSLIGLWVSFKQITFLKTISIITLLFAFVALFFGIQTGTTGGEIRHTEIRSDPNNATLNNNYREENEND
ncbi:hypothetical protein [Salegentibacter flavus]|uniref:DUF2231 domain-containing protein n=1 Tax=Salegentibacter flavus TaxID=287099 RepID=A0A1I5D451_9FLAO|nr:hypothetical protein [Salegentibacter flavus]SFN94024.1 hypothetical protein SAMN05660413_03163 [Salegentibacter flavus]